MEFFEKVFIFVATSRRLGYKKLYAMEQKKFKSRLEEIKWKDSQNGWGPLTEEEKAELDDAVRMITNLATKGKNEVHS
ncbi:MAG: hypothetical protein IKP73_18435 [Bacteroidales bacterium]|nr:hypothetical protein [Bacteroidales bacterium]